MGMIPFLRDRMLADDRFMFKARPTAPRPAPTPLRQEPRLPVRMQLGVEIAIDAGCATFAEVRALPAPRGWDRHPALEAASTRVAPCQVRKRADEFWAEFEFYLSDLIVGVALDAALVSMMANPATLGTTSLTARLAKAGAKARSPRACSSAPPLPRAGRPRPLSPLLPAPQGLGPKLQLALAGLPSSIFAAAQPGQSFTVGQRLASYGVKFLEYGVVGTACGFGGQAIANTAMLTRRALQPNPEEEVVAVPPLARARLRGAPPAPKSQRPGRTDGGCACRCALPWCGASSWARPPTRGTRLWWGWSAPSSPCRCPSACRSLPPPRRLSSDLRTTFMVCRQLCHGCLVIDAPPTPASEQVPPRSQVVNSLWIWHVGLVFSDDPLSLLLLLAVVRFLVRSRS